MNKNQSEPRHSSDEAPAVGDVDTLTVESSAGRRQFIRQGAAFLLTSGALVAGREAWAADCDQNAQGCQQGCSDSDAGENSDPTGAGKRCSSISISSRSRSQDAVPAVGKVLG